jgi:hypothetical protein
VGRAKHMRIMPGGALEADQSLRTFVRLCRTQVDDHRGAFYLEHPMDKGAVTRMVGMRWNVSEAYDLCIEHEGHKVCSV